LGFRFGLWRPPHYRGLLGSLRNVYKNLVSGFASGDPFGLQDFGFRFCLWRPVRFTRIWFQVLPLATRSVYKNLVSGFASGDPFGFWPPTGSSHYTGLRASLRNVYKILVSGLAHGDPSGFGPPTHVILEMHCSWLHVRASQPDRQFQIRLTHPLFWGRSSERGGGARGGGVAPLACWFKLICVVLD
jgi:hypothetical protein